MHAFVDLYYSLRLNDLFYMRYYSCVTNVKMILTQAKRMVKLSIIMVMEVLYRYIIDNM